LILHKGEYFYTDDYLVEQMELAYQKGMMDGSTVKFHAVEPRNTEMVNKYVTEFWNKINDVSKKSEIVKRGLNKG